MGIAQLDGVKRMFRGVQQPPPSALDTGAANAVGRAEAILDDSRKQVLLETWWADATVFDTAIEPDGSSNIVLPTDTIRWQHTGGTFNRLGERDGKLYDTENDTDEFASAVRLTYTVLQTLPNVSYALANYIVEHATLEFVRAEKGAGTTYNFQRGVTSEARRLALKDNRTKMRINVLRGVQPQSVVGNRHGYVREP